MPPAGMTSKNIQKNDDDEKVPRLMVRGAAICVTCVLGGKIALQPPSAATNSIYVFKQGTLNELKYQTNSFGF
jgi:hypothetical protein